MIDDAMDPNPWISSPSGYHSLQESEVESNDDGTDDAAVYFFQPRNPSLRDDHMAAASGNGYEGLEGIYRFIEECDQARS
jgi:hypothetical protein